MVLLANLSTSSATQPDPKDFLNCEKGCSCAAWIEAVHFAAFSFGIGDGQWHNDDGRASFTVQISEDPREGRSLRLRPDPS